jgi:hypothetical protein
LTSIDLDAHISDVELGEQKENISLTAYAGRGIVIYSGRNGGGDEALPFPDLSEIPSLHARSLGVISLASSEPACPLSTCS